MVLLLIVLALLTLAGIAASLAAVRSDGYGPRSARDDRYVSSRRWI